MDRLAQINKILNRDQEQLVVLAKALIVVAAASAAKVLLRQIEDLQAEMHRLEAEKAQLVTSQVRLQPQKKKAHEQQSLMLELAERGTGDRNESNFLIIHLFQQLYQAYHQGQQTVNIPYHPASLYLAQMLCRSQQITSFDLHTEGETYLKLTLNLHANLEDLREQILDSLKNDRSVPLPYISPELQILLEQTKDADPDRRLQAIEALGDYACGA